MDAATSRPLPRPEPGPRRPAAASRGETALERYREACRAEEAARLYLAGLGRLHGPMA